MKYLATLILLAGCGRAAVDANDQCLRREIFNECLRVLPAGPLSTKYNDWAEVVNACASQAYTTSIRNNAQTIKPECRA